MSTIEDQFLRLHSSIQAGVVHAFETCLQQTELSVNRQQTRSSQSKYGVAKLITMVQSDLLTFTLEAYSDILR